MRRSDWVARACGLGGASLPFLAPAGPGNTGVPDVAIGLSILLTVMWVTREGLPIGLPYAYGTGLLVLGGALGAAVAQAPGSVAFVLVQDVFLLAWAAVLALGWRDPGIITAVTRAWCTVACLYAGVMVVAYVGGVTAIAGVNPADGVRASYTFPDPNLAANYLVVSFFMVRACQWPHGRFARYAGYTALLLAIVFTGSNGAAVALVVGTAFAVVLKAAVREGTARVLMTAGLVASVATLVVGFVLPRTDLTAIQERAANGIPLLRDSIGRSNLSGEERVTLVQEGFLLWQRGDAAGYGPARTKATLSDSQAPYVKEAHNDYLATLLERGVIGTIGLLILMAAAGMRCVRLIRNGLPPPFDVAVPHIWALVAIGPVMATSALFYEVLHFRHLWAWLGIVAALELAVRRGNRRTS
ncbi:MAG: O-antigen ligase family protein [Nocardioidaceae bacterium]